MCLEKGGKKSFSQSCYLDGIWNIENKVYQQNFMIGDNICFMYLMKIGTQISPFGAYVSWMTEPVKIAFLSIKCCSRTVHLRAGSSFDGSANYEGIS